ncbi:tRNase Z TRZ2, chloroplastic-like isoform X2 [Salvia splendens]|uniref:tRNase Z TRZ2, chloroplastic-like isoform X2 n=1 Tax=Salvia splendens TaxID=180675 RepID=UPI001C27C01D|nr:tRNase Z TRZ2, chloroplastic-like isoform X2 [Salvia splendens]
MILSSTVNPITKTLSAFPLKTKNQMMTLNPATSNLLNFNQFHQFPPPTLRHHLPIQSRTVNAPVQSSGVSSGGGGSGFLTAIGRAIEEEEYRKARAEVHKKSIDLDGYSIEGLSIGGHETCVIVPELKTAFDIGRCPAKAVQQNFLFITHAHLDHIGGLPMYIATRGLYSLKPPTVFVPPSIMEDVEQLINIHRNMGQVELNIDLVPLDVGETYEMRNDLVVRPFRTHHVITSQGYVIYSVRKKLRKQYTHLKGKQIEKIKKSGVEITDTILCPEVAFTGDTTSDFYLDPRSADALRAKILITEATFLDESVSAEHAREHGHTHIDEIMENAQWIRNKTVVLTHFSSRYHLEVLRMLGYVNL